MSAFVALATAGLRGVPVLPGPCVEALRLPGGAEPSRFATEGFACAASPFPRHRGALVATPDLVVVGDVRLDGPELLDGAPGARAAPSAPGALRTPDARHDIATVAGVLARAGAAGVARLRGDFSLAWWDPARRRLVAARDGLGVRPLYYAAVPGGVVVANVLDAIRAHPAVSSRLNPQAVTSFLASGDNNDLTTTTFAAIRRLAPGTGLEIGERGEPAAFTHWQMPDPPLAVRVSEAEGVARYRTLLGAAVRDRVDPGSTVLLLSGGVDSTTIAAAACQTVGAAALRSVTLRVPAVEDDTEVRLASAVARRLSLAHAAVMEHPEPRPEAPRRTPEPHDDGNYVAWAEGLAAFAGGADVVLEGEDGDALFAPPGLAATLRREPVAPALWRIIRHTLVTGHHPYLGFWLRRRLSYRRSGARRPPAWLRRAPGGGPAVASPHVGRPPNRARPEAVASLTAPVWQTLHAGMSRAYHGVPVEFRWPLLDTRLLDFVFALPAVPWSQRKWLPRRAYRDDLPPEVTRRPKTTRPGYYEHLVATWRLRDPAAGALHPATLEWVDPDALGPALASRDVNEVTGAWRAVLFDRWVREAGAA